MLWILLEQGVITHLAHDKIAEEAQIRLFAIQNKRIFARLFTTWVKAVEMPITTLDSLFHLRLGSAHAGFNTVVDARCV